MQYWRLLARICLVSLLRCFPTHFISAEAVVIIKLAYELYNEAVMLSINRDWLAAIDKYQAAVNIHNEFPECHQNLALLLDKVGRFTDSMEHHVWSIQVAKTDYFRSRALVNLAMLKLQFVGVVQSCSNPLMVEVFSYLEEAVRLEPSNNANARFSLGLVHVNVGEYVAAFKHFQKALEIDANHSLALLNIGNFYFRLNDFKNARYCPLLDQQHTHQHTYQCTPITINTPTSTPINAHQ